MLYNAKRSTSPTTPLARTRIKRDKTALMFASSTPMAPVAGITPARSRCVSAHRETSGKNVRSSPLARCWNGDGEYFLIGIDKK